MKFTKLVTDPRFEEGATQFREDVAVNPNDTEEARTLLILDQPLKLQFPISF